jgi:hypothetical protein
MLLPPFTGPGSTPVRRSFWSDAFAAVMGSRKIAGRHVTVDEHPGKGSIINVERRAIAIGACCIGEDCSILSEADCIAAGGTYQGDGTDCDPNPCLPPTTGACCQTDDTCDDGLSQSECEAGGGTFHPGQTCSEIECFGAGCACPPGIRPTHISATATPSGEIGVRGECQLTGPYVDLSGSPIQYVADDIAAGDWTVTGGCCFAGFEGALNIPIQDSTNEDCCTAFGATLAVFGFSVGVRQCADEEGNCYWELTTGIGIGGGGTGYCNWPPITYSWFPNTDGSTNTAISEGQTSITIPLIYGGWATHATFSVNIALEWSS